MLVRVQTKASCETRKDIFKTSAFSPLIVFHKHDSGNKLKWRKTSNHSRGESACGAERKAQRGVSVCIDELLAQSLATCCRASA